MTFSCFQLFPCLLSCLHLLNLEHVHTRILSPREIEKSGEKGIRLLSADLDNRTHRVSI